MNPPQRISSGTAHVSGQGFQDATGRRSSWSSTSANPLVVIPVQLEPAILPSYTILPCCYPSRQFLACRRARFRRRNFFLRHFQRWLPVFFQAREPRFMVNSHPTCLPYMRASSVPHASFWPRLYAGSPTIAYGHPIVAGREHHSRLPDRFSRGPRREGGLQNRAQHVDTAVYSLEIPGIT